MSYEIKIETNNYEVIEAIKYIVWAVQKANSDYTEITYKEKEKE